MKVFRLMILVLAVCSLLAFACKAKEKVEAVADSTVAEAIANPIDTWTAEVKTLVETWEKKAGEAKITDAELQEFVKAKDALVKQSETLGLEANSTEAQKPLIQNLMARMDKLINETLPKAMK